MGAKIRKQGSDLEEAHDAARSFASSNGFVLVEDGRDRAIAEGAGTIAVELLRRSESLDAIVVPLGDGALLGGMARWVKAHHPQTQMIGVCASGASAMERSWRAGRVIASDRVTTIADGIAVRVPFREALEDLQDLIDDILLVQEETMVESIELVQRELGLLLEPAGAAGVAAVRSHGAAFRGKRIAVILTGANPAE
jgi:threonine dehydratase